MADDLIKSLLEAGVHFGHQTKRWNPKMKRFIFGDRSGIYIIDLEKTVECLNQARDYLYQITAKGGKILFVGTKKQAQEVIKDAALHCNMFYVNNRWLGGLLTNFQTIKKSVERLKDIERMGEDGTFQQLTKKEVAKLTKEKDKLLRELQGVREMGGLPQAIFVVDSKKEEIAIKEANRLQIPIVALIDTNCDPDMIDYPIPGNDDALKSIRLISSLIAESVLEGRKVFTTSEAARIKVETDQLESQTNLAGVTTDLPEEMIPDVEEEAAPASTTKTKGYKEKAGRKGERKERW